MGHYRAKPLRRAIFLAIQKKNSPPLSPLAFLPRPLQLPGHLLRADLADLVFPGIMARIPAPGGLAPPRRSAAPWRSLLRLSRSPRNPGPAPIEQLPQPRHGSPLMEKPKYYITTILLSISLSLGGRPRIGESCRLLPRQPQFSRQIRPHAPKNATPPPRRIRLARNPRQPRPPPGPPAGPWPSRAEGPGAR